METENELNLTVTGENKVVTILHGETLPHHEPQVIAIAGILDSPARWLEKRVSTIGVLDAHVLVIREKLKIVLITEEKDYFATEITGSLQLHPDFLKFKINSGEYLTAFDMATLFKMNSTCFENRSECLNLVAGLQTFKAKVNKEIEMSNNNRGDRKLLVDQTVKSNLPESINLCIPIFKGTVKQTFLIEVYVNPDDLTCTLVSPAANDLVATMRDIAIDDELAKFNTLRPEIVIIEQ